MTVDTTLDRSGARPPSERLVTLMQTDIEGSTRLLEALGDGYPALILRSRALLREALERFKGKEVDAPGDAFFATFAGAVDAVRAAVWIVKSFHAEAWPQHATVRVRIGLHTGQPQSHADGYFGLDVHRTARIMAAASGGQVLMSAATRALIGDTDLPADIQLRDLGSHRLKDLRYPEVLFDVLVAGLPTSFGALRSADSQPGNLPLPPTPFIGRQRQLDDIRQAIVRDRARLLTLTGPGGTGKTRLAIEAGRAMRDAFPHGVYFVSLVSLTDPHLISSAIVQTLGLPEFGTKTPLEALIHHLGQRELLIVLDNFEQILAGAAEVTTILNSCPKVTLLVTSREALNVRWERQYQVQPLGLPRSSGAVDAVAEVESVRLFVDRAKTYDSSFDLTQANAPIVAAICRRLDGLPLAIELAASWLALYTPDVLLERLQKSTALLAQGPQDVPSHQRTLRDLIGWSYNLLGERDQIVFRRLAVFAGGCTVDSAATVASDAHVSSDIATSLVALVRKNLVTQTVVDGQRRIGMLETIREFASQELDTAPEHRLIRDRHMAHYLALAELCAPGVVGRDQRRFVTPLLTEQDNLRAALAWAIHREDAETTARLLTALVWLWIPRGLFAEGRTWATRAVEAFGHRRDLRAVGLIFEVAGWLEVLGGDYVSGLPRFEASYSILSQSPVAVDRVRTRVTLGVACLVLGDERGPRLNDEAAALCEETTDETVMALASLSAGIRHQLVGDAESAFGAYRQALQRFADAGNVFWSATVLQNLAVLSLFGGDPNAAARLAFEALGIGREYDYPMNRNTAVMILGGVAIAKGNAALAATLFGFVERSLTELGVTFEPPEQAVLEANIEQARALLGPDTHEALAAQGRRWSELDLLNALTWLRTGPESQLPA